MRLLTAEEYSQLPKNPAVYREELIRGVVFVREDFPSSTHGWIAAKVCVILLSFVMPRRLGEVATGIGFVLETDPDTVRGPDVSFVAVAPVLEWEGLPYRRGAPDIAVEILSKSNRPREVAEKTALYLRAGTRLVWWLDPLRRTVTVYRPNHDAAVLYEGDVLSGEDVLPGFRCPVADMFDPYSYSPN